MADDLERDTRTVRLYGAGLGRSPRISQQFRNGRACG